MTYILSHTRTARHPKIIALSKMLGISKAQAIGHLHLLWWWAKEYAPDGNIGKFKAQEIARAAEWPEDKAEMFLGALKAERLVDSRGDDLFIHDWLEYNGCGVTQVQQPKKRRTTGGAGVSAQIEILVNDGIPEDLAQQWIQVRKFKRLPLTEYAWSIIKKEAQRAGMKPIDAVKYCLANGWAGFRYEYYVSRQGGNGNVASAIRPRQPGR